MDSRATFEHREEGKGEGKYHPCASGPPLVNIYLVFSMFLLVLTLTFFGSHDNHVNYGLQAVGP